MSVGFTVSLGPGDWDSGLGAWRCSALGIPGAQVSAVYAESSQLDPAWYEVQTTQRAVRWVHGTPHPEQATLSIELTKELSTRAFTGWIKLAAIAAPVVSAIVVALIPYLFSSEASTVTPAVPESTIAWWTLKGVVKPAGFESHEVETSITPPDLRLKPDFTFEGRIPIETRADGRSELPKVIFTLKNRPGFIPLVVHLVNPGQALPPGVLEDFDQSIDQKGRVIDIRKPIEFPQTGNDPAYRPAQAQAIAPATGYPGAAIPLTPTP